MSEQKDQPREKYEAPKVELIELDASEIGIMACQTPSGSGACCTWDVS